jgi:glucose/arabinose dehydrogenase
MKNLISTTSRREHADAAETGSVVVVAMIATAGLFALVAAGAVVATGLGEGSDKRPAAAPKAATTTAAAMATLSPSGLPVGLLSGQVTRTSGVIDVSNVRLLVRADGTGSFALGGGGGGDGGDGSGKDVVYVQRGPGQVDVSYDGVVCANPRALTLTFTVRGDTVVVDTTKVRGCFASAELVADFAGTELHVGPLPPG